MLTWSANCVISSNAAADQETTFAIPETKFYLSVLIVWTQHNAKLLE